MGMQTAKKNDAELKAILDTPNRVRTGNPRSNGATISQENLIAGDMHNTATKSNPKQEVEEEKGIKQWLQSLIICSNYKSGDRKTSPQVLIDGRQWGQGRRLWF
jgi:hypothetical protein